MNKFIGVGNLGKKPELKFTKAGGAVINFDIAITEKFTDKKGDKQEKTEWVKIVAFGNQAENCAQYLDKGSQVMVEGKLSNRSYEDKAGVTKYVTEVIADNIKFL